MNYCKFLLVIVPLTSLEIIWYYKWVRPGVVWNGLNFFYTKLAQIIIRPDNYEMTFKMTYKYI